MGCGGVLRRPAGDIPEPGDYDGVGNDELAVYRPSTGQFLVLEAGGTVETITIPGLAPTNLVPVPAQYDNQYYFTGEQAYKTEAAVFDPSTGTFTIAGPPTGTYTVTFQAGDIPVSADYAGTGSIQPAVFRPSTKQFLEKAQGVRTETVIATFPTHDPTSSVPVIAPLSYRIPSSSGQSTATRSDADPHADTDPDTRRRSDPDTNADPDPGTPTPTPSFVAPTLAFASGSAVVVNGIAYVSGQQPWFIGTATPARPSTDPERHQGDRIEGRRDRRGGRRRATTVPSPRRPQEGGAYTLVAQAHGHVRVWPTRSAPRVR